MESAKPSMNRISVQIFKGLDLCFVEVKRFPAITLDAEKSLFALFVLDPRSIRTEHTDSVDKIKTECSFFIAITNFIQLV